VFLVEIDDAFYELGGVWEISFVHVVPFSGKPLEIFILIF